MEHGNESFIKELKQILRNNVAHIVYEHQINSDIGHPVFVFIDYSPKNNQKPISVVLPSNLSFRRLWINLEDSQLKAINGDKPKYHSKYDDIQYQGDTYHPYSVDMSEYQFKPAVVKDILETIYAHYNGNDT